MRGSLYGFQFTLGLMLTLLLGACADTRYYWQSVTGHVQLMQLARPIDDWLADDTGPPALKNRLMLAQEIRRFAVLTLGLPDNASYHSYADLQRRHVVWNVVAAPEFSLTLKTWCFPVAGCVGYRGYFSEDDANAEANDLRAQGLEAGVYGVVAYSTLGWMNWLGGDPLLNTFIHYPQGELARMLFHELAHQVIYVSDDSMFNESFATAVERLGGAKWLQQVASPESRADYAVFDARRQQFRALTRTTRQNLDQIYKENHPVALVKQVQNAMKTIAMREFQDRYAALKASWGGFSGYDHWAAQANNATFGAQATYDELVPGFEALFNREGQNWGRFYDAVRQLAKKPAQERQNLLKQWALEQQHG